MGYSTYQYEFTGADKTELVKSIKFRNTTPLLSVYRIVSFKENDAPGTFLSKQFRYSFDDIVWSNWQTLSLTNLISIPLANTLNFYIEFKYERALVNSANIRSVILLYEANIQVNPQPQDSSIDADYLGGQPPSYYLDRSNLFGPYPNLDFVNIAGGIGPYFNKVDLSTGSGIYFKSAQDSSEIFVDETSSGHIQWHAPLKVNTFGDNTIDGSLDINGNLYAKTLTFDASVILPDDVSRGTLWWNDAELALNVATGIGPVLQVGQEIYILIYNDTSTTIPNGLILRPKSATFANGQIIPTVEYAKANNWETVEGTLMASTMDIPPYTIGLATRFGRVRGANTSGLQPGATAYISDTSPGYVTNERPRFPSYAIPVGTALSEDPLTGEGFMTLTGTYRDTFENFWNGVFREPFVLDVSTDGTNVIATVRPEGSNTYQTMIFSDGFTTWKNSDTSILLNPGTDEIPQINYIYIPQSTKELAVSIVGFPDNPHIKIGKVLLQSANYTDDPLILHEYNDPIQDILEQGHLSHITERLRLENAKWISGAEGTVQVTSPTASDVYIQVTAGVIYQLHKHIFRAFDTSTGDHVHLVNDPSAYRAISNLNELTTDALGNTLNNTSFSVVLWGSVNGNSDKLFLNLPIGTYAYVFPDDAVNDADNYSVYTIPSDFIGTGFLIARFTFLYKNGDWSLYSTQDLRGNIPGTSGGGGGGLGVTSFTALSDTPSSYIGNAKKVPIVSDLETALEFSSDLTVSLTIQDPSIESAKRYNSTLDPSLAMLTDVGGIPAGTTVADLNGDELSTLWDTLLFPTVYPTYVNPSLSFTEDADTYYEVNDVISVNFSSSFDRGQILISGNFQNYRSGLPHSYYYSDPSGNTLIPDVSSSLLTNNPSISNYVVGVGTNTFSNYVAYTEGPQPLDSKGNVYGTPLAAGNTSTTNRSLTGVYPLFATTSNITILTKQSLISMSTTTGPTFSMVAETVTDKQKMEVPDKWIGAPTNNPVTGIQTYNTVAGSWEYQGGSAAASLTFWTTSAVTETIQGVVENYTRYTYNSTQRGATDIRIIF